MSSGKHVNAFIPLAFLLFVGLSAGDAYASDTLNIAPSATVSTSFVSAWEKLGAVNDGYDPAGSADYTHGAYGNWNGEADYGKFNWVEYTWSMAVKLSSFSVYWWDDGMGIDQPTEAYFVFWNGIAWADTVMAGTALDCYNAGKLTVRTNKVRLYMKSLMATGILEWKIFTAITAPCTPTVITPLVQAGDQPVQQSNIVNVPAGDSLLLDFQAVEGGTWSWTGPSGFTSTLQSLKFKNVKPEQSGTYIACYINDCGAITYQSFIITVRSTANASDPYTWTSYNPTVNYNFRDEFPEMAMPVNDLDDCAGVVGTISSGWWTFKWGASANPLVTPASINPMLVRLNKDFAYFRDVMGWPPDKRAKRGYRSAVYLYGSGLCTDDAPNTATGGWQGTITCNGEQWPMVLISYYPVYCFDPSCSYSDREYQSGAVVHEGIHSVLADLPGCREAAWFHEGGNTWLQQEAYAQQSGNYSSMGFLNGASFVAPFMPIECYSGWLQDGTFGGPSAEGVNRFEGSTQICTWRNLLGGVQYSNTFPTYLGMTLGNGSIPWIWRYCEGRVLEGLAEGLGEAQVRRLIVEYRAKQALIDMGKWSNAIRSLLDSQFNTEIKAEWQPSLMNPPVWRATPYARTTNDGNGLLTPEKATTPGWSGANQIPLKVTGDIVRVNFIPIGSNMSCQLCYRTVTGQTVYSNPVLAGECSLRLENRPANDVVFAVICNTDYIYKGEATRTIHFDYRLKLVEGVTGTADVNSRWYQWDRVVTSSENLAYTDNVGDIDIYPNPVSRNGVINIRFSDLSETTASVELWNLSGQMVMKKITGQCGSISLSEVPCAGLYFMVVEGRKTKSVRKIIIR